MLAYVIIGLYATSLLLNIVGLAIPYWQFNVDDYNGLWKACALSVDGRTTCRDIPDVFITAALEATRAMEILGMLLIFGALVLALLKQFVMKDNAHLTKIGASCAIFAGILMIIGTIIYAQEVFIPEEYFLHVGFGLCIIAGIIGIAAGVIMSLASVTSSNDVNPI